MFIAKILKKMALPGQTFGEHRVHGKFGIVLRSEKSVQMNIFHRCSRRGERSFTYHLLKNKFHLSGNKFLGSGIPLREKLTGAAFPAEKLKKIVS